MLHVTCMKPKGKSLPCQNSFLPEMMRRFAKAESRDKRTFKREMPQRGIIGVASHSYGWNKWNQPFTACR